MKSLGLILTLVRYNLRLLPSYIWPMVAGISLVAAWTARIPNQWTVSGNMTTHLSGNWFIVCAIIGACFFGAGSGYAEGRMPDGLFLPARPIPHRIAYFSRMVFLYILMLAPPLSVIYAQRANPDLQVDFYHWAEPLDGQINFYQKQFPDSSVVHEPPSAHLNTYLKTSYVATVVIPSGKLLVAYWDLFVVIVLTLVIQLIMFFMPPAKARYGCLFTILAGSYFFVAFALMALFPALGVRPTVYEDGFFLFVHHGGWFALFTLEAFILVQWIAAKRIKAVDAARWPRQPVKWRT